MSQIRETSSPKSPPPLPSLSLDCIEIRILHESLCNIEFIKELRKRDKMHFVFLDLCEYLNFLGTVKAAFHECVIRTGLP